MRSNQTIKYFASFIKSVPDLSGKEKLVLLKRLKERTNVAIGEKWNLTEGRIRQIEKAAIAKIKSKTHQLALFKIAKGV